MCIGVCIVYYYRLIEIKWVFLLFDWRYELERRGAEDKRRQKSEGEKPKIKELEERRRRESATSEQNGDRMYY